MRRGSKRLPGCHGISNSRSKVENDVWTETGYFAVEPTFFHVFSYPLLSGDPDLALRSPESIVVTESMARKYFGRTDVLGETIVVNQSASKIVTAVAADPPRESHLQFAFLVPFSEYSDDWGEAFQRWDTAETYAYIRLQEGASSAALEHALPGILTNYLSADDVARRSYRLQPLSDIHLHSAGITSELQPQGDIRIIRLFAAIASIVLLIASVNYVNLATARSMMRAKEAGLRKVMGAHRRQLTLQYLGESVAMSLVGGLVAVLLAIGFIPLLNTLLGTGFQTGDVLALTPALGGLAMLLGMCSGLYPALVQARVQPALILKGLQQRAGRSYMRDTLVVIQFTVAIILIIGSVVLYRQMLFIQSTDLGFDGDHRIVVRIPGAEIGQAPELRAAISNLPTVRAVTASSNIPSESWGYPAFTPAGSDSTYRVKLYSVDFEFVEVMGLHLVSGRPFSGSRGADSTGAFILNEAAVNALGWTPEAALGQTGHLGWVNREGTVIGVVKDFHFRSLRQQVEPMVLTVAPDFWWKLIVLVKPGQTAETLAGIEEAWKRIVPGWNFEFDFLDESVAAMYAEEERMAGLVGVLTVIAAILAGLGLFGLVSFVTQRRTREIGVRKVLGASTMRLILLLSREFAILLVIAFLLAAPLAWWAASAWLDGFAYDFGLGVNVFLAAAVGVMLLATVSVVGQTLRAARMSAVDAIRTQ